MKALNRHHAKLCAYVHSLVTDWQDAEELIQETLLVLWRKFDEYDPAASFSGWAFQVAQFEVFNYRRRLQRRRLLLNDSIVESLAEIAAERMDDLDSQREALEHCVKRLNDKERIVLSLRYSEGGDAHSTATALKRTVGQINRILRGVRGKLLRCIRARTLQVDQS